MYIVQCIVYTVHCVVCGVMYSVHCTLYSVLCVLYSVHCIMHNDCIVYIVHRTVYIVQWTLYSLHFTVYIVECIVYIVQCTMYSLYNTDCIGCIIDYNLHCTGYNLRYHLRNVQLVTFALYVCRVQINAVYNRRRTYINRARKCSVPRQAPGYIGEITLLEISRITQLLRLLQRLEVVVVVEVVAVKVVQLYLQQQQLRWTSCIYELLTDCRGRLLQFPSQCVYSDVVDRASWASMVKGQSSIVKRRSVVKRESSSLVTHRSETGNQKLLGIGFTSLKCRP